VESRRREMGRDYSEAEIGAGVPLIYGESAMTRLAGTAEEVSIRFDEFMFWNLVGSSFCERAPVQFWICKTGFYGM
jgi:hypothetical protein